ncbi:MAG: adenosylcobalamin-dependent ribonucleoside-diphosphate reductase [Archaeoglobaceae archaeon]
MRLTPNAHKVLERRYLIKDERGRIVETPDQMFRRVARAIANIDREYGRTVVKETEDVFYNMMTNFEFLPNSPTLMNAGTEIQQLSACFVLQIKDSMQSIFDGVKNMAIIQKTGGGTGMDFSELRPKGDVVKSTGGVASGPVSFMRVFDTATEVTKQGGRRRGANMGILRYDHPDIREFITTKLEKGILENFNLSVSVEDEFMETVKGSEDYWLINPRNGERVYRVNARKIFDLIVDSAWKDGDPGLVFIDEINRRHPLSEKITATNPCGEVPLLPFESCNLGSINLAKMLRRSDDGWEIDYPKLEETVRNSVHFLDNVIDANHYPFPEIEEMTRKNRKIGLGVMGWAELLLRLGIKYDSQEAINLGEEVMSFISRTARDMSVELGKERGSFPGFESSTWFEDYGHMRNATVTTIAPTGSISIIAGCSSGIEPLFAISYVRHALDGETLLEVNPEFEEIAKKRGLYSEELMEQISKKGSLQEIDVPEDVKELFVTALDIEPEWHVRMQAAFQKYTDNAVSKTVNLPPNATREDIASIFMLAYELKCKGITVYRYGSRENQVLSIEEKVRVRPEYSGGSICRECNL